MGAVKHLVKGVGKTVGGLIGIDMGAAAKAAKAQAKATNDATAQAVKSANYQAEAAANQIKTTQEQEAARMAANDLLSRPTDSAEVDLSNDDGSDNAADDLLGRKRSRRAAYRDATGSGLNI